MTLAQYAELAAELGRGPGQGVRDYRRVFREGLLEEGTAKIDLAPIVRELNEDNEDGPTVKFAQQVPPAKPGSPPLEIESVIIPMIVRTGAHSQTLCVSSQVGCALGCEFCETAQMGLMRNLTAAEIVGQWFAATHLKKAQIRNIVFMGMGEPMDNLDEVIQAIRVLTDHNGAAVPMHRITVSTVGRLDGLRRLGELMKETGWKRLGISVSVNAPNDEIRSRIMPINRSAPMVDLRQALLDMPGSDRRKIVIGYVLIPGVNDAPEHAAEFAEYLAPFGTTGSDRPPRGLVNVIPYNPRRDSPWRAPTEPEVDQFVTWLMENKMFVKRRRTKGRSQMAACGQLGNPGIRKRRFVELGKTGVGPGP